MEKYIAYISAGLSLNIMSILIVKHYSDFLAGVIMGISLSVVSYSTFKILLIRKFNK